MSLEILLGAALEAGLGLIAEVGFREAAQGLKDQVTQADRKQLRDLVNIAAQQAAVADLRPLLEHAPFQEEIVSALLDPTLEFDLAGVASTFGERLPAQREDLRRFFDILENVLTQDAMWGPILERYSALRQRRDVQRALQAQNLAIPARELVHNLNANLSGSGGLAQGDHAVAAGANGIAVGGNVQQIVHLTVQQLIVNNRSAEPGVPDPANLRQTYLNRLYEQTNTVYLGGIDPKTASDIKSNLHLHAVYTALLTDSPIEEDVLRARGMAEEKRRPESALGHLNRQARLVLLGDPGSGKSTFVNFVALCLAGEALQRADANLTLLCAPLPPDEDDRQQKKQPPPQPWTHGALLPVRIVLRDFAARGLPADGGRATAAHLWEFVARELKEAELGDYVAQLRRELLDQGGLILLDGLDEVPEADQRRVQIKAAVEDFARTFARCRFLVTSRTYAYQQQEWQLTGFQVARLAPFTRGQVVRFVEHWYAHIGELRHWAADDAQGRAEVLKRAIFASDQLSALAERPLLLTLMASLHAWRGGSLPERREELYADAVDLLLDWWENQRVVRNARGQVEMIQPSLAEWLKVDRQKVRALLNELAYRAHSSQTALVGTADVAEGDLVNGLLRINENPDVKFKLLVHYLSQRAGLLVPRGVGVYTFPHRTFQEYLAACYLTDHEYPDLAARLAREEPGRWREATLLAGAKAARGTTSAIWLLVDALCYGETDKPAASAADGWGALLAGQSLVEIADLEHVSAHNQGKVTRVRQGLVQVMQRSSLPALERAAAGRTLAVLGDQRSEVMTIAGMQFCYVPAGRFWMGSGEKEGYSSERPQHPLDLPAYWIGRYPVTNAQYAAFVQAGGYTTARYWQEAQAAGYWKKDGTFRDRRGPERYNDPFGLPNHPVVGVSWYEALAFSRWLSEQLGREFRLPNEPEWEKAARGGEEIPGKPVVKTLGAEQQPGEYTRQTNPVPRRVYPWEDAQITPELANYDKARIGSTSAVGCFLAGASPYGAEEMAGNVWEWTRSLWNDGKKNFAYPYDAEDGREKLSSAERRVLRGGSWNYPADLVRCAYRSHDASWGRDRQCRFPARVPRPLISDASELCFATRKQGGDASSTLSNGNGRRRRPEF